MKETSKSLRLYFVIAGLFAAYLNGRGLVAPAGIVSVVQSGLALLVAVGFLGVAAVLPRLLATSTLPIKVLLGVGALLAVLRGVLFLSPRSVAVSALSLIIYGYLYANTTRLAAEVRATGGASEP